jgi:thiol-disulfide isomerase/thioredoxin
MFTEVVLKQVFIKRFKAVLFQLVLIASVIGGMNYWKTRNMASGASPKSQLVDLVGQPAFVPNIKEGRISLVYFFAPWCGVCRLSMGNLNQIKREMPDVDIQIVALDYESKDEVTQFINDNRIEPPVYMGNEFTGPAWGVSAYPSYFIVDQDSVIRSRTVGYSSKFGIMLHAFWARLFN